MEHHKISELLNNLLVSKVCGKKNELKETIYQVAKILLTRT